jgi:hypothetical protein
MEFPADFQTGKLGRHGGEYEKAGEQGARELSRHLRVRFVPLVTPYLLSIPPNLQLGLV